MLTSFVVLAAAAVADFDLPAHFIHGAPGEPVLEVHRAAANTWVLRQGKASNFEAPFLYLIAGTQRALLLDTGAETAADAPLPLRATVDGLVHDLPLVVAHTHAHGDHHAGDVQFADRAQTQVVGLEPERVAAFFGLEHWPDGEATLDLGGRVLTVLPLPGHEPSHIAVYDAATRTLFSGDTLYPGLLTVRDYAAYRTSAQRLEAFARAHPIQRVLGAHIEMTDQPRTMYPLETRFQPAEHALALGRAHIAELATATAEAGDFLADELHRDFILGRVSPPSTDRPSTHGMLVVGREAVYFSHLPMAHSPHDYQLIFEAQLPVAALAAYRADAQAHRDEVYTFAPTSNWVLPDTIKPGATITGDLYRGHFERGGTVLLSGVSATVAQIVHFRHFERDRTPDPARWLRFGRGAEQFLAHRIEGRGDVDEIVAVEPAPPAPRALGVAKLPLAVGDRQGGQRVTRVIYTETGDLAD